MTPERWKRVEAVYAAVTSRPVSTRADAMADLCGNDADLRREVESLLAHADAAADFLETPAFPAADIASERDLIGRVVGPYRIISLLGAGGMGEVYRAHDEQLHREVAIKFLPRLSTDPRVVGRFQVEARALAALNCPHIGAIYGLEHVDGSPVLVLELVEGETLAERMAGAGGPLREALAIARQIAVALEAAHARHIVHRDLKPSNIKITQEGVVKILDFGLAKLGAENPFAGAPEQAGTASGGTRAGAVLGTAGYMSPEQAAGAPVDESSDLWAFGVVLLQMLTGRQVFPGEAVVPADTPPAVRKLLERCLDEDPTRRMASATAVRVEIDAALAARRRPRATVVVAVATLVCVVVGAGLVRLWQQDFFWRNPLAGATVERLTDFEGDELGGAISADGTLTTFVSDRDGPLDVWASRIGSGEFVNLTKGRFHLTSSRVTSQTGFSGDSRTVWFLQQGTLRQGARQPVVWTSWLLPAFDAAPRRLVENGLHPAWSPDGRRLAYNSADPGDPIFIADKDGDQPTLLHRAQAGVHNHFLTWSPDGRFIYFVRGTPQSEEMDIWRLRAATGGVAQSPERITTHRAHVTHPAWLDARTLIYTATAEDGSGQWLYAVDVEHRIPHRVSAGVAEEYLSVAVSNATPRRLVAALATPKSTLWTVPLSDHIQTEQTATRVQSPNSRAGGPRVGARSLAFLSSKGGAYGLWTRERDVDRELWRGDAGGIVAPPAISPDGGLICFSSRRNGITRLHIMHADGTGVRMLADGLDVRGPASWSPDGKWVVVAANRGDGSQLFKISAGGGTVVPLLTVLADRPVWSPDGRFIVYTELLAAGGDEIKAMTPDGGPFAIPAIRIGASISMTYRFMPDGQALVVLEGAAGTAQNFFHVDLVNGAQRKLTDLAGGSTIQHFDVSPDGKSLVFDRVQLNSDIVLMRLLR